MNDLLRRYRRSLREWNNKRKLHKELLYYHRIFESRHLNIPDDATIGNTLRNKYHRGGSKQKGQLNIVAIYHHYNWEDHSLKASLTRFGRVRHYDWFDEFNHQKREWHTRDKAKMNRQLIETVRQWAGVDPPDVVFSYLSGELVSAGTVREMSSLLGVPMVNLSLNDKELFVGKKRGGRVTGMRDICPYFDLCWTSTEDALKKYCVEGALPVYLPEGANPDIHRPYNREKVYDVSFVGQCYGNRSDIIQRLKARGIDVEAFGTGWPNGPLSTQEMIEIYSQSRINLGFSGVAGHGDTYCLKGRDFEIPMSGGLYLTEYNAELERVFDVGEEIVAYRNFEDLVEKIAFLLSHPDEAEAIRTRGFQRARREHTWEMRFQRIFTLLGLLPGTDKEKRGNTIAPHGVS